MRKENLYIWIIGLLLLANLTQIGFFLFKPKHHGPPRHEQRNFKKKAFKILDLTKEQRLKFRELAHEHKTKMVELNEKEKALLIAHFHDKTETTLTEIQQILTQKIEGTQSHFDDVKSILEPEQMPNFEKFKEEALQKILR